MEPLNIVIRTRAIIRIIIAVTTIIRVADIPFFILKLCLQAFKNLPAGFKSFLQYIVMKIDSTRFGEVVIDGRTYFSDVTLYWDGTIEHREKDIIIDMDELSHILEKKIDIIVIGTGQEGTLGLMDNVRQLLADRKIRIFELKSPDAIEIFNSFASQGKRVAAIIHTTG
jgi:hypothetical protein